MREREERICLDTHLEAASFYASLLPKHLAFRFLDRLDEVLGFISPPSSRNHQNPTS